MVRFIPEVRGTYGEVRTTPHLLRLFVWSAVGRLPMTSIDLAISLAVVSSSGSYVLAGTVSGAMVLGHGVASPLLGRLVDRRSPQTVLLVGAAVSGPGLVVLAWAPPGRWYAVAVLAFMVGVATPPVLQVFRTTLPRVTPAAIRQSIFSLDTAAQEFLYVLGPAATAAVIAVAGARWAVGATACVLAVGSLGFSRAVSAATDLGDRGSSTESSRSISSPAASGAFRRVLAGYALVALMTTAVELSLIEWSFANQEASTAALLTALWASGSFVGGMVMAGRKRRGVLPVQLCYVAIGLLGVVGASEVAIAQPWLLATALFISGTTLAPALAVLYDLVVDLAPAGRVGEAFGWLSLSSTVGAAASAPAVGLLLERRGSLAGTATAVIAASGAAVSTLSLRHVTAKAGEE